MKPPPELFFGLFSGELYTRIWGAESDLGRFAWNGGIKKLLQEIIKSQIPYFSLKNTVFTQQQMINYIDATSVDEYAAKVKKLGGKIVVPKTPVPGRGYFALCLDTEINLLAFGK